MSAGLHFLLEVRVPFQAPMVVSEFISFSCRTEVPVSCRLCVCVGGAGGGVSSQQLEADGSVLFPGSSMFPPPSFRKGQHLAELFLLGLTLYHNLFGLIQGHG